MDEIETNITHCDLAKKIEDLQDILSLLPGHVYWLDHNLTIRACNNAQARSSGFTSPQHLVGKSLYDVQATNQAKRIERLNYKIMEEGKPYVDEETIILPNLEERTYLSHKAPLRNKHNKVIGLLGVSLDITDRKRMERELKLAKEKAELADQTKSEFFRNLEHDIRTPLCGIMNVVAYLETLEENPKKKEFLSDIHLATHELLNYLENIVEFSQIDMGAVPFILRELDLQQLIQGILNLESAAAKDKRIDLILDYPDNVPKLIMGDRFRIHRFLLNLISNAIKFTQRGHVKISVALLKQLAPDEIFLKIKITDTGIGIAKKYHGMIYDKFTRCNPSNKSIYKGKGLGLWIVKQFINDLQGHIHLESKIGKGSTFICELPFKLNIKKEGVS